MTFIKPFATLLLTGFISTGVYAETSADYKKAVSAATAEISAAKKANFEWRDSSKILKSADKAAKAGDYKKATSLANKAKRQGELAQVQAKLQKNAGPL